MMKWLDRRFEYVPPAGEYPVIVERLRGTPARMAERVHFVPAAVLTRPSGDGWTAQENIGHLLDLETLWSLRVDDFLRGATNLTAADMSNQRTNEAGHTNARFTPSSPNSRSRDRISWCDSTTHRIQT
jgi:hypothetical protein